MTHWKLGDAIDAPYVKNHPTKRAEFVHEIRRAVVVGFSMPDLIIKRNYGNLGDALAEFDDGERVWTSLAPKEAR